ncbi:MAG: WXG100 family type VII secretion target [Ruminococcus sp.]|jgi:WXG100 family type VII secretion target|nr:WXG100 family type VII secretion target [Ruminococcus sp.]
MADTSIIKVDPQVLKTTAETFQSQGTKVSSLTQQMMTLITGLSSQWEGEASTAYVTKFKGLQDDIEKLMKKINEYTTDLQSIAAVYESYEQKSTEEASALSDNVIS